MWLYSKRKAIARIIPKKNLVAVLAKDTALYVALLPHRQHVM